ncbi:sensor histidine kinase [Paeniglutamicibacter psychrophenolicus]|uniref:sensor histidine kinase n=1 Tax=Paeniglutamicibacter psychrophenolicus TaxID=257454 RepID=UPI0027825A63|nr:histidine kinase [Paeniglutamicibacter psychrophenolicus]MDQ0093666.1 signal transduction histidine kinase [Paeniglutamicibacter psychrophenolicus]
MESLVSVAFALALGLLWARAGAAAIISVLAMILSLIVGKYLFALLVVPLLLGLVTLTQIRKFSLRYLCFSLLWAILIVVVRPLDVGFLVLLVPLILLAYFVALFARKFQEQRESDRKRIEDLRRKQQEAVEAERKAIARDLHDIVAHDITVISMQAKAAGFSGDPAVAQAALKVIGNTSKEALQDLRVMLNVLRSDGPATRVDGSLVDSAGNAASSLEILIGVEVFAERLIDLGHPTKTMADPRLAGLPQSAQAALYRVLQESTTNIVKHAEPHAACRIEALVVGDRVWLEIANSLPRHVMDQGFDIGGHSSGIVGMSDRMAAFGGTLSAKRVRGDWVVRAELPATTIDQGVKAPEGTSSAPE